LAERTGKSESTIKRLTVSLTERGIIARKNGRRNGFWEVLKQLHGLLIFLNSCLIWTEGAFYLIEVNSLRIRDDTDMILSLVFDVEITEWFKRICSHKHIIIHLFLEIFCWLSCFWYICKNKDAFAMLRKTLLSI
jgi:hypothetical protein